MNDLNTIIRLNNEAVERHIPAELAAGKTVVAEHSGIHFVGYQAFSGPDAEDQAQVHAASIRSKDYSATATIHRPKTEAVAA